MIYINRSISLLGANYMKYKVLQLVFIITININNYNLKAQNQDIDIIDNNNTLNDNSANLSPTLPDVHSLNNFQINMDNPTTPPTTIPTPTTVDPYVNGTHNDTQDDINNGGNAITNKPNDTPANNLNNMDEKNLEYLKTLTELINKEIQNLEALKQQINQLEVNYKNKEISNNKSIPAISPTNTSFNEMNLSYDALKQKISSLFQQLQSKIEK